MDDNVRYCTECGRELAPTDKFCPACGANIDDMTKESYSASPQTGIGYGCATNSPANSDGLKTLSYLMLFWGIIGTIYGIYTIISAEASVENAVNMLKDMDLWEDYLAIGYTEETLKTITYAEGACITVSGVCALMAGHFTFRGEKYKIAVITCTVATIAAFIGIITLLVGIFVTYRLTQYKSAFKS